MRLYGVKSHTEAEFVIPAHIDPVWSEIVSSTAPDPSTLLADSRVGVLIAPIPEVVGPQPAPVSIESNWVLLLIVAWWNSAVPRFWLAVMAPREPFVQVQVPA